MKKKVLLVLMCTLLVAAVVVGCSTPAAPAAEEPVAADAPAEAVEEPAAAAEAPVADASALKIGISMNSADEFRSTWLESFTAQAQGDGHTVVSTNADGSADKQISDIESMIQQQIDVAVVHAFSSDGIVPALDALSAAEIPVVLVDFPAESDNYTTLVTDEQYMNGVIHGEYVNDWLAEDSTRVANVGYIVGMYSMEAAMPRMEGFFDTCTAANKVAEGEGGWTADGAMSLTEDWMQAHPDINVYVTMSDEMALGTIQALKAANVNMEDVLVLGIDGSKEGIAAVKAGELDCTAARDVEKECRVALDTCVKIMSGETVEKTINPEAITALTVANVDAFGA